MADAARQPQPLQPHAVPSNMQQFAQRNMVRPSLNRFPPPVRVGVASNQSTMSLNQGIRPVMSTAMMNPLVTASLMNAQMMGGGGIPPAMGGPMNPMQTGSMAMMYPYDVMAAQRMMQQANMGSPVGGYGMSMGGQIPPMMGPHGMVPQHPNDRPHSKKGHKSSGKHSKSK